MEGTREASALRHRPWWSRWWEEIGAHVWWAGRWSANQWRRFVTYRGESVVTCWYCSRTVPLRNTRAFATRDGDEHRACVCCLRLFGLALRGVRRKA